MRSNLELATNLLAAVCVILLAATVCGRLAQRVGQPRVVGEMVSGVLLGPTLLGRVWPEAQAALFPDDVRSVLYVLSTIGLTFYMFLVGASVDHNATKRDNVGRAIVVAAAGLVLPFTLGFGAALLFRGQLSPPDVPPYVFALFMAGALSITAFPMLARILQERGITRTRIGGLALIAASIDDAAAWILLAVVAAIAHAGGSKPAYVTFVGAVAFAALMLTVGRRSLRRLATRVERDGHLGQGGLAAVLIMLLFVGWFTDYIGIFSVFGGFVAGLAVPRSDLLIEELQQKLSHVSMVLLLPIFFAFSGLNTHLGGLSDAAMVVPLVVILAVACIGKYGGCTLAVRCLGFSWRHGSAVGGLMNARGLMILIFINIGLVHGLLTPELFSIMVLVAVITTAAAMPIYRRSMPPPVEAAELAAAAAWASDVSVGVGSRRSPDAAETAAAT